MSERVAFESPEPVVRGPLASRSRVNPVTRGSLGFPYTTQASLGGIAEAEEVGAPEAEHQEAEEAAAPDPQPVGQAGPRRGALFGFFPFGPPFPLTFG